MPSLLKEMVHTLSSHKRKKVVSPCDWYSGILWCEDAKRASWYASAYPRTWRILEGREWVFVVLPSLSSMMLRVLLVTTSCWKKKINQCCLIVCVILILLPMVFHSILSGQLSALLLLIGRKEIRGMRKQSLPLLSRTFSVKTDNS